MVLLLFLLRVQINRINSHWKPSGLVDMSPCSLHFPCALRPEMLPASTYFGFSQIALGCFEGSCVSWHHPFFTGLWPVWPFSSVIVKFHFSKEETGPRHKGHLPSRHSHHKWIGKEPLLSPGEKTNIATIQRGSTTENLQVVLSPYTQNLKAISFCSIVSIKCLIIYINGTKKYNLQHHCLFIFGKINETMLLTRKKATYLI